MSEIYISISFSFAKLSARRFVEASCVTRDMTQLANN